MADGGVTEFEGDLENSRDWLAARQAEEKAETRSLDKPSAVVDRKAQRRQEAELRQKLSVRRTPLESKLAKLEAAMDTIRASLHTLDALIAEPDMNSEAKRTECQKVIPEHGELAKRMTGFEKKWLEIKKTLYALEHGLCANI